MSLAFVLAAAAATLAGPQEAEAEQRSLIVGDWKADEIIPVECPENHICLNVFARVSLDNVETLMGPELPRRAQVQFWYHSRIGSDARWVLAVEPSDQPRVWNARRMAIVRDGEQPCVRNADLTEAGLILPTRKEEISRTCFFEPRFRRPERGKGR